MDTTTVLLTARSTPTAQLITRILELASQLDSPSIDPLDNSVIVVSEGYGGTARLFYNDVRLDPDDNDTIRLLNHLTFTEHEKLRAQLMPVERRLDELVAHAAYQQAKKDHEGIAAAIAKVRAHLDD